MKIMDLNKSNKTIFFSHKMITALVLAVLLVFSLMFHTNVEAENSSTGAERIERTPVVESDQKDVQEVDTEEVVQNTEAIKESITEEKVTVKAKMPETVAEKMEEGKTLSVSVNERNKVTKGKEETAKKDEVKAADVEAVKAANHPSESVKEEAAPVTETVTEAVTEAPVTETVTEAPTEAVTEAPTEAVTEAPAPVAETPSEGCLTAYAGVFYGPSGKETYYNLDMSGVVSIMRGMGFDEENYPYWVREDGCKMLGPYIMVAANLDLHPRGSVVPCSLGTALVCDTGGFASWNPNALDIATTW